MRGTRTLLWRPFAGAGLDDTGPAHGPPARATLLHRRARPAAGGL